jgi:hypothetical protein
MDETGDLSYARDCCTECRGPTVARAPESHDQNKFKVQEGLNLNQGSRYEGHHAATWPLARNRRKARRRTPLSPTHPNTKHCRRGTSVNRKKDTCSEHNSSNINEAQAPAFVDRDSLPLRPIKPRPIVNGSVVNRSNGMESSQRPDYQYTEITDQGTDTQANEARSISPPRVTEALSINQGANSDDTPPGATSLKVSRKNDEIQLYNLLQRIRRLRETIWGLRSRVQGQRVILRSKQYAKAAADDQYMRLARLKESRADQESVLVSREGRTLQELFQDCEKVRAEYGPLEDDCNALEDQLGSQEYELTRLEENFVSICNLAVPQESQPASPENVREGQSESSSTDVYQNYHPFVAEYLSKLGDVDIFRERLERHQEEREALKADKETRQRVNLSLTTEDEAWLEQAEELENYVLKDLLQAEADVEELKKKCLSAGLLDGNGEPKDFQTQEQEAFAGDTDVDAKGQKSEYLKFPNLLPQPGTKDMKFKSSAPRPEEQSESAGDHINQWLLHSLRSSPLDVNLLARTFEAEVGDFEAQKWQSDVRHHWYKDGAIKDASRYRIDSATSETPVYERSKLSTASLHEHKIEPVLGMTGRKTAVSDTSSVSGSEFLRINGENEIAVGSLPRSKYDGTGR